MTTQTKTVVGALVALLVVVLGALGISQSTGSPAVSTPVDQDQTQSFGSTVVTNPQWFAGGIKWGKTSALFLSDMLTVAVGADQAVWKNNTGQTVYIDTTHVVSTATTSTAISAGNFTISAGATTSATIAERYSNTAISAATNVLAIDKYNMATGTQTGVISMSLTNRVLADNYAFHASSTNAAVIAVPNGWYYFVKIDSPCSADGTCGRSATSTARGFSTLSVPFWYHYTSPN